jgi:hypothetical protein
MVAVMDLRAASGAVSRVWSMNNVSSRRASIVNVVVETVNQVVELRKDTANGNC